MTASRSGHARPFGGAPVAPTRGELAYEVIRKAIIAGEFGPGARLRLGELTKRYGFGAGVLREALPRLVAEGFLESQAQLGFRVVELTASGLLHLTEVRLLVEAAALSQAIRHGDAAWEAEIVSSAYLLDKATVFSTSDALSPEWLSAHSRFHGALLAACPNDYLRELSRNLRDRGEIFRAWGRGASMHRDVAAEHRAIAEAVLARDEESAVSHLESHIRATASAYLENGDSRTPPLNGDAPLSSDEAEE